MHLRYSSAPLVFMYVWMVRMLFKRAPEKNFSPKKHGFIGLTPVYSETTALNKPYFILKLQSVRKFLRKRLLSVTMALKTLYQIYIQNIAVFPAKCSLLVVKSHLVCTKRAITTSEKRM